MNTDLQKRFEDAADNYIGHPFNAEERFDTTRCRIAFKEGAEHGYKVAIEQAKKWLKENADKYCSTMSGELYFEEDEIIADFEKDMNELIKEK